MLSSVISAVVGQLSAIELVLVGSDLVALVRGPTLTWPARDGCDLFKGQWFGVRMKVFENLTSSLPVKLGGERGHCA